MNVKNIETEVAGNNEENIMLYSKKWKRLKKS